MPSEHQNVDEQLEAKAPPKCTKMTADWRRRVRRRRVLCRPHQNRSASRNVVPISISSFAICQPPRFDGICEIHQQLINSAETVGDFDCPVIVVITLTAFIVETDHAHAIDDVDPVGIYNDGQTSEPPPAAPRRRLRQNRWRRKRKQNALSRSLSCSQIRPTVCGVKRHHTGHFGVGRLNSPSARARRAVARADCRTARSARAVSKTHAFR